MTGWIIGGLVFLAAADAAFLFFWVPRLVDRKLEHFQSDLMDRHYDEVENMYRTIDVYKRQILWQESWSGTLPISRPRKESCG